MDEYLFGGIVGDGTTPSTLREIQSRILKWHEQRFPYPRPEVMALKCVEELGELASAIIGMLGRDSATGSGDVGGEAADVLITLLALMGRAFSEVDLESEVDAKLAILNDPASGHRASLNSLVEENLQDGSFSIIREENP